MIEYENFQKSLKHLEEQFANYRELDKDLPRLLQEAVKESVIQRFEICWDCLLKSLRLHIGKELDSVNVPQGTQPTIRKANDHELLPSPVEQWMDYAQVRTETTHDYSGEKAEGALKMMGDFIGDAIHLYQTLTRTDWE